LSGGAFSVILFRRTAILWRSGYRKKWWTANWDHSTHCVKSFNSIAIVSREEKRTQTSVLVIVINREG